MERTKSTQLNIRLTPETVELLKQQAVGLEMTVSTLIRILIKRFLQPKTFDPLLEQAIKNAQGRP